MVEPRRDASNLGVLRIVFIYAIVGALWIYLSDTLLGLLIHDPQILTRIAVFKGLAFILLTASLLYFLIRRYTRQLLESEEDLKLLLELMPVGVAWNNNAGQIQYANGSFVERFGYTLSEIPTVEDWFLRAYPDPVYRRSIAGKWRDDIADAQLHGTPVQPREAKVTCKDGTVCDVIINTRLERNRTLVIFTDITEREKTQKEILKTQKLESLGLLAGGIAHDFNNVLTGILGNISFAQMLLDDSHDATIPLQQAEQASLRAAELAHQLLTFAKGNKPNLKPVPARRLVEESVSLVLRGANVKAILDIPDSLHTINADEGQLCQAFNNIIINSAQAMPGGGSINIAAENQVITDRNTLSLPPGDYVRFTFRDGGCGIPEEDQKRIFDPYFTTKPGGTGLGLSSVHSIIGKHGGHIGVSSVVGKGTTFEILLPSIGFIIPEGASDLTDMGAGRHCGGAILVMDDEEMIRSMTTSLLEMLGYSVKSCATGEEAVSMYRCAREAGEPFSAVIMDLTVPGAMGGKDAAAKILEYDPQACLIVSSGYSNDTIMTDYKSYGFRGAVAKPYKVTEIAQTLGDLLAHK